MTKVWSQKDYPLLEVGEIELNRNPENYFAEVEQVALAPSNIVPGLDFSPDKLLINNIAKAMHGVDAQTQARQIEHFRKADSAYGEDIKQALEK